MSFEIEAFKTIDTTVNTDINFDTDIAFDKLFEAEVEVTSEADITGNIASATFEIEAVGKHSFAEQDVSVIAAEGQFSSIAGTYLAAASPTKAQPKPEGVNIGVDVVGNKSTFFVDPDVLDDFTLDFIDYDDVTGTGGFNNMPIPGTTTIVSPVGGFLDIDPFVDADPVLNTGVSRTGTGLFSALNSPPAVIPGFEDLVLTAVSAAGDPDIAYELAEDAVFQYGEYTISLEIPDPANPGDFLHVEITDEVEIFWPAGTLFDIETDLVTMSTEVELDFTGDEVPFLVFGNEEFAANPGLGEDGFFDIAATFSSSSTALVPPADFSFAWTTLDPIYKPAGSSPDPIVPEDLPSVDLT